MGPCCLDMLTQLVRKNALMTPPSPNIHTLKMSLPHWKTKGSRLWGAPAASRHRSCPSWSRCCCRGPEGRDAGGGRRDGRGRVGRCSRAGPGVMLGSPPPQSHWEAPGLKQHSSSVLPARLRVLRGPLEGRGDEAGAISG